RSDRDLDGGDDRRQGRHLRLRPPDGGRDRGADVRLRPGDGRAHGRLIAHPVRTMRSPRATVRVRGGWGPSGTASGRSDGWRPPSGTEAAGPTGGRTSASASGERSARTTARAATPGTT